MRFLFCGVCRIAVLGLVYFCNGGYMELITFLEIQEKTGMARSTVYRRVQALKLETHLQNLATGSGRPKVGILRSDYPILLEFNPNFAKQKGIYKTSAEKSEILKRFTTDKSKNGISEENRRRGLYNRLTNYGGLLKWEM